MTRVLLVPDLPLERWPSMDRYAHRLYDWLENTRQGMGGGGAGGLEVRLAAHIGELTREARNGRDSGGFVRFWAKPLDPSRVILPGPLYGPHRYTARYFFYPQRLRWEARHADLVPMIGESASTVWQIIARCCPTRPRYRASAPRAPRRFPGSR